MNYCFIEGDKFKELLYIPITMKPDKFIPSGIKIIGEGACKNKSLPKILMIPEGVEYIEPFAFANVTHTTEIYLPRSIIKVHPYAFANMKDLKKVYFYSGTNWGDHVFVGCENLTWIYEDKDEYRCYYYKNSQNFALMKKNEQLSTYHYDIYIGTETDKFFPDAYKMLNDEYHNYLYYYCIITKNNKEYMWPSDSVESAVKGAQYQASGKSFKEFFGRTYTPEDYIDRYSVSYLGGICMRGVNLYYRIKKAKPDDKVKIGEGLEFLIQNFPVVAKRLIYGMNHQEEVVNVLKWDENHIGGVNENGSI